MTLFILPKIEDFQAVDGAITDDPTVVMYVAGADNRVQVVAIYPDNLIYHSPPNAWMQGATVTDVTTLYPSAVQVSVLALIQ